MSPESTAPRRSRRPLALALALILATPLAAHAAADGWKQNLASDGVPRLVTPGIDRAKVEQEDIGRFDSGQPLRYAIPLLRKIETDSNGQWEQVDPLTSRWRLRIASPGASSINLGFTKFWLPDSASLEILDAKGSRQYRAFTAGDNESHGQLWTPLVRGDEILIELRIATADIDKLRLSLTSVNHGYRLPGEALTFLKSGACNVDVVCPEGDGWRDQIKSSAVISTGGGTFCSGSLITNVARDGTPFFLTAAHCNINAGNAASLVTFWNFENSVCRAPGSGASGGAGDGTLTQFNTGSFFRAASAASDFTLVELDDPIDPAFELYWSGWDRRSIDFPSAVAIHHPSTDEKRISFEDQPTTTTTYLQDIPPGNGSHIRIADWDLGTTEPGSSGSPLYSPEKRVIGQLHGGFAACGNNDADWYGRFSVSWTGGNTNSTRLSNWLDPTGTGVEFVDGVGGAPFDIAVTPAAIQHCVIDDGTSAMATVDVGIAEPGFSDPVALAANDVPAGASAAFGTNPVTPGNSSTFTLSDLQLAAQGSYMIGIEGTSGTESVQTLVPFDLAQAYPDTPSNLSPVNGATNVGVPVQLSWQAAAAADGYLVEVFTAPPPAAPIFSQTVAGTSVQVPGLAGSTTYSWRVTSNNACGDSATSTLNSFTTVAISCQTVTSTAVFPIGPNAGTITNSPISVGGLGTGVTSLQLVGIRGTHTWVEDLDFQLLAPNAQAQTVVTRQCGSADNFHLSLDDDAAAAIACPLGDPAGAPQVAQPSNPLAVFNGVDPNGNWTLRITDNANLDGGSLSGWGLTVCTGATGSVVAEDDDYPMVEDTTLTVSAPGVLGNDSASSGSLSATLMSPPTSGDLAAGLGADGSFSYTPDPDFCGLDSFTYSASNGSLSDTATVDIDVACVNDAPQAGSLGDLASAFGIALDIDAGAVFTDADMDTLAFSISGQPASLGIDAGTGRITGTPVEAEVGVYTVTVTAQDPSMAMASASFELEVLGTPIFADGFED